MDLKNEDKPNVLPENLSNVLLDDGYRDYLGPDGTVKPSREHDYEAYKWFVKNILMSVNHELTELLSKQVQNMGSEDFISKTYTTSDEAFAILLVVNYESRWRNHVLHPTNDKNLLATDPLYATKFTDSKRGYCKLPWTTEGIELYNTLVEKVGRRRSNWLTGVALESVLKKEFTEKKKNKKRKQEVIETKPVVGGALQRKLAALKAKAVAV